MDSAVRLEIFLRRTEEAEGCRLFQEPIQSKLFEARWRLVRLEEGRGHSSKKGAQIGEGQSYHCFVGCSDASSRAQTYERELIFLNVRNFARPGQVAGLESISLESLRRYWYILDAIWSVDTHYWLRSSAAMF